MVFHIRRTTVPPHTSAICYREKRNNRKAPNRDPAAPSNSNVQQDLMFSYFISPNALSSRSAYRKNPSSRRYSSASLRSHTSRRLNSPRLFLSPSRFVIFAPYAFPQFTSRGISTNRILKPPKNPIYGIWEISTPPIYTYPHFYPHLSALFFFYTYLIKKEIMEYSIYLYTYKHNTYIHTSLEVRLALS